MKIPSTIYSSQVEIFRQEIIEIWAKAFTDQLFPQLKPKSEQDEKPLEFGGVEIIPCERLPEGTCAVLHEPMKPSRIGVWDCRLKGAQKIADENPEELLAFLLEGEPLLTWTAL